MSIIFRELLKKVGSGSHTHKDLTREEAANATEMILNEDATPAQIGAFLIAHRIKRPTSEELAGMLDAYDQLGCTVPRLSGDPIVTVMGTPYDGRSRTAPVTLLTALMLAASGVPVIQHGGDCMATKYGIPLVEIWQGLGIDFTRLSLTQVHQGLEITRFGFIYTPNHFPATQRLVNYRDQIGKRPPFATIELIWLPYAGNVHLVAGFVHPPTEEFMQGTLGLRGVKNYTLIKGLEGSCDLPRERTAIISTHKPGDGEPYQRLKLHSRDYGFEGKEVPLESKEQLLAQIKDVLAGKASEFQKSVIWNGGFYLWRCGVCPTLEDGLSKAESLLITGALQRQLAEIESTVSRWTQLK
ncbi:anthranilate phosphoribosyltransferase family protein [Coleofasciculus sp. E2-BRE-01]|uniref:anthranilate phosphoribosyltransferase family protein n=1 Tax=Coleofasciculus sp. E2-BRE-01 TaxID=3069524 RepID=UPI0032F3B362